jgi:hypothetical protein
MLDGTMAFHLNIRVRSWYIGVPSSIGGLRVEKSLISSSAKKMLCFLLVRKLNQSVKEEKLSSNVNEHIIRKGQTEVYKASVGNRCLVFEQLLEIAASGTPLLIWL